MHTCTHLMQLLLFTLPSFHHFVGVAHKLPVFLRHHIDDSLVADLSEELLKNVPSLQLEVVLPILIPTQQVLNLEWECICMWQMQLYFKAGMGMYLCVTNAVIFWTWNGNVYKAGQWPTSKKNAKGLTYFIHTLRIAAWKTSWSFLQLILIHDLFWLTKVTKLLL